MAVETDHRPTSRDGTRGKLLSVAASLFSENGYMHTTTAKIANRSGLSEPAIYLHFSGKEQLAVAVVDKSWQIFEKTLAVNLETGDNPINALLDTEKQVHSQPEGRAIYRLISEASANPIFRERLGEFVRGKLRIYREISGDDYVALRLSVLIGIGLLATVEGPEIFDATIDQLKKEFGGNSQLSILAMPLDFFGNLR